MDDYSLQISYGVGDQKAYTEALSLIDALSVFGSEHTDGKEPIVMHVIVPTSAWGHTDRIQQMVHASNEFEESSKLEIVAQVLEATHMTQAQQLKAVEILGPKFNSTRASWPQLRSDAKALRYFMREVDRGRSHLGTWKRLVRSKKPAAIIVEAEVDFCSDFGVKAAAVLEYAPRKFDLLCLGNEGDTRPGGHPISDVLVRTAAPRCTHGYVLSQQGASKALVLKKLNQLVTSVEEALGDACSSGALDCFSVISPIVFQAKKSCDV